MIKTDTNSEWLKKFNWMMTRQTDYFGVFTYSFSEAMLFSILIILHGKGSYHSRNCDGQYTNWVQKALLQIKLPKIQGTVSIGTINTKK